MGKNLKGKELGSGFYQRQDGRYEGRFRDRFGRITSVETRNRIRIMLQDIMDKAISEDYLIKNPVKGIKIILDERKEPHVLSQEDQRAFFEVARGTFYFNYFVVAVNTGLRIGELTALTWSDIDYKESLISVTKSLTYHPQDPYEQKRGSD